MIGWFHLTKILTLPVFANGNVVKGVSPSCECEHQCTKCRGDRHSLAKSLLWRHRPLVEARVREVNKPISLV